MEGDSTASLDLTVLRVKILVLIPTLNIPSFKLTATVSPPAVHLGKKPGPVFFASAGRLPLLPAEQALVPTASHMDVLQPVTVLVLAAELPPAYQ